MTYKNISFFLTLFFCCNYAIAAKAKRDVYDGISYDVFTVPVNEQKHLQFFWQHEGKAISNLQNLDQLLEKQDKQLVFASNGGIYDTDFTPEGLYIEKGKTYKSLNLQKDRGNFYLKPNGVFLLTKNSSAIMSSGYYKKRYDSGKAVKNPPIYAIQSGPMLVIDKKIHARFRAYSPSKKIRNGVGIDKAGNLHFVIVNERVNLHQFASIFKQALHCENALYLDGTISEMYMPELREHKTSVSHNNAANDERLSRPFVSMIGLVQ
jgi:uncharacterized protein YigE (DUF2233 family)